MSLLTLQVLFIFARIIISCIYVLLIVDSQPSSISKLLFLMISSCYPLSHLLLSVPFSDCSSFIKFRLLILAYEILILHLNNCNYLVLCWYCYLHILLKIWNYYSYEINAKYLNSDNLSKLNHRISNLLQSLGFQFNYLFKLGLSFCSCDDLFFYNQYFSLLLVY